LKNLERKRRTNKHNNSFKNFENEKKFNNLNNNERTEETKFNDEKIFEIKENCIYVTLNRLIYSYNCLLFYYINIALTVILFLLSLVKILYIEDSSSIIF